VSQLRVLILSHDYPPRGGGIASFTYYLANALSGKGISVTVMAGSPPGTMKESVLANPTVKKNLEVIRIPRMNLPPSPVWYQTMNLNKLRCLISDFDIVHSQDQTSFPIICYCKKDNPRIPWVVTVHGSPVSELYYAMKSVASGESEVREFLTYVIGFPLWDLGIRVEAKLADALVPVSQEICEEIREEYRVDEKKLFTIHNGVNVAELENIARANANHQSKTEVVNLFYAGRLYWRKGILHLLKSLACMTVNFGFTGYRLEVFGEGPLKRRISSLVSKFGLEKNVKLRGFVTRQELVSAMARSDIVCVPSLYEACPVAMIEAMVLARPVVAFSRPFSRELLSGIPHAAMARSIEDYAARLYSLCTSEDLRTELGRRLRKQALDRFDMEKIAEKYIQLYSNLLS